jgi:transcriptional regulator with XRE-family HTH domain
METLDGWRYRNSLTQRELARRLGCEESTVGRWLRGENVPQAHHRRAIERLTGRKVRVVVQLI